MCGGGGVGAWSGDVSIHCVFLFSAKTLNCCDLMLLLLVLEFMQVCVFVYRYS